jgi:hypothetical protein
MLACERLDEETGTVLLTLTPTIIEKMLEQRQLCQAVKFRTTCTDCVPNY